MNSLPCESFSFLMSYLLPNKNFCANTYEHWLAVFFVAVGCVFLTLRARKLTDEKQHKITQIFAWILVINVLIWQIVKAYVAYLPVNDPAFVPYNWGEDLPLNPCNWLAFVALAYSYTRKNWMWILMYFFVWVFTFNAIITPALNEGFPHFNYCKFWVSHTGLVMFVIHLIVLGASRISFKQLLHAYGYLQIFTLVALAANYLVVSTGREANYFFLMHKPITASILDILGPWPWYIIQGDLVAFGLFLVAWLFYRER